MSGTGLRRFGVSLDSQSRNVGEKVGLVNLSSEESHYELYTEVLSPFKENRKKDPS